jgi:predicted TPR repeat methyltransferase
MVDKARLKGCYDHLAVAELVAYMDSASDQGRVYPGYDLLVAADVFVYIGDLGPVFASGARQSVKG